MHTLLDYGITPEMSLVPFGINMTLGEYNATIDDAVISYRTKIHYIKDSNKIMLENSGFNERNSSVYKELKLGRILGSGSNGSIHEILPDNDLNFIGIAKPDDYVIKFIQRSDVSHDILRKLFDEIIINICLKKIFPYDTIPEFRHAFYNQTTKKFGFIIQKINGYSINTLLTKRDIANDDKSVLSALVLIKLYNIFKILEKLGINHRDLNYDNIMIETIPNYGGKKNISVFLIDFGLSCMQIDGFNFYTWMEFNSEKKCVKKSRDILTIIYFLVENFTIYLSTEFLDTIKKYLVFDIKVKFDLSQDEFFSGDDKILYYPTRISDNTTNIYKFIDRYSDTVDMTDFYISIQNFLRRNDSSIYFNGYYTHVSGGGKYYEKKYKKYKQKYLGLKK